jgi:hypothetical protein
MRIIHDAVRFVAKIRKNVCKDELSRSPLTLLRFEWKGNSIECDWLMRSPDPWDRDIPAHVARELQTQQALRDALYLRSLVLDSFPAVMHAELRMFRSNEEHELELMMTGRVSRANEVLHRVTSVAMRAKLCGFQFVLSNGAFDRLVAA